MGRLAHIDAMRGLAITLVLFFHNLGPPGAQYLPYGNRFANHFITRTGWVGVELFFLISGYVIFMSLSASSGLGSFFYKRWLRLFPAMLIATLIIFAVRTAYPLPGLGAPPLHDLLPGLSFIAPSFYHLVFRADFQSLDGVFWTLYTEASFYILFACLYWRFGARIAISALILIALIVSVGPGLAARIGLPAIALRAFEPFSWMSWQLFGWFAAGALFYQADRDGSRPMLLLATVTGIGAALLKGWESGMDPEILTALLLMVAIFAAAVALPPVQRLLANPVLLFIGFASYPFYLLHCMTGRTLIKALHDAAPATPPLMLFGASALAMLFLSYAVARHAEPAVRKALRQAIARFDSRRTREGAALEGGSA